MVTTSDIANRRRRVHKPAVGQHPDSQVSAQQIREVMDLFGVNATTFGKMLGQNDLVHVLQWLNGSRRVGSFYWIRVQHLLRRMVMEPDFDPASIHACDYWDEVGLPDNRTFGFGGKGKRR